MNVDGAVNTPVMELLSTAVGKNVKHFQYEHKVVKFAFSDKITTRSISSL